MPLYATQAQQDALLTVNTVFGINNSTTSTAAIDLGCATPFPTTGAFTVQISTTASANGANSKNVNVTLQHANVNLAANFADITELAPLVIAANVAALPASTRNIALPPSAKQFIRLKCVTENAGGNPNDAVATLKLLF